MPAASTVVGWLREKKADQIIPAGATWASLEGWRVTLRSSGYPHLTAGISLKKDVPLIGTTTML